MQTAFNVDHTEWWTGSVAGASAFSATSVHIDPESGLLTGYVGLGDAMFMVEPAKAFFPSDSGAAHEVKIPYPLPYSSLLRLRLYIVSKPSSP